LPPEQAAIATRLMKKSSTINQGAGSNSNNSGCITDITGQLGKTEHGTHAVTAMATNNKNVRTGKIWIGGVWGVNAGAMQLHWEKDSGGNSGGQLLSQNER